MHKLPLLALSLLISGAAQAQCPSLDGTWDINLAPTGKTALKNQYLFSALRLSVSIAGTNVTPLAGIGFENPIDPSKEALSRSLDTNQPGTLAVSPKCRLQLRLATTEKRVFVAGREPRTEDNVAISFSLKGDPVALIKGYAGTGIMQEAGSSYRVAFTLTSWK